LITAVLLMLHAGARHLTAEEDSGFTRTTEFLQIFPQLLRL
jgi:hypothetical protein